MTTHHGGGNLSFFLFSLGVKGESGGVRGFGLVYCVHIFGSSWEAGVGWTLSDTLADWHGLKG